MKLIAGVMTGTSMDAIDIAVLQRGAARAAGGVAPALMLKGFFSKPLAPALRSALVGLQHHHNDELREAALTANHFADAVSVAVMEALSSLGFSSQDFSAIGVHGQTIRHQPALGYSIQLNAPSRIAEATGITVVSDFRSRDIAAGGQGAPLVPAFHEAIFSSAQELRAIVNIGGVANISWLGRPLRGHDTGPGNMLMDAWIERQRGAAFDQDGAWAASGQVHPGLLNAMLGDSFFSLAPPKSTGRDHFSLSWLEALINAHRFHDIPPRDIQATLLALTAQSIAREVIRLEQQSKSAGQGLCDRVLICGGGAQNTALMNCLSQTLETLTGRPLPVASTALLGWPPQTIEAAAFAWLADRTISGLPGNCPEVTGALGPRILGAITPA